MKWPSINIPPEYGRLAFGLGLIFAITGHGTWIRFLGYFLVGLGAAAGWKDKKEYIVNYNYQAKITTEVEIPRPRKKK